MNVSRICLAFGVLAGGWGGAALGAVKYRYVTFHVPGSLGDLAVAINASGAVVGNGTVSPSSGFLFQAGTITVIAPPGAYSTKVVGVSDDGTVFGWFVPGGTEHTNAFTFKDGTYQVFGTPGVNTVFTYVNPDGSALAMASGVYPSPDTGLLYQGGRFVSSVHLDGQVQVYGINSTGAVVGYRAPSFSVLGTGFTVKDGIYTPLAAPAGDAAVAYGINDAGVIAGRIVLGESSLLSDGGGFIQNGTARINYKYPGAYETFFVGVDAAGDAAGGAAGIHIAPPAFVREHDGTFVQIAPPGSTGTTAQAINPRGQVTGLYYPSGKSVSWIFIATPE